MIEAREALKAALNITMGFDLSDHLDDGDYIRGINLAFHKAAPTYTHYYVREADYTHHVIVEQNGKEISHRVYTEDLVVSMPEYVIREEAYAAGNKAWNEFLETLDWNSYWETSVAL